MLIDLSPIWDQELTHAEWVQVAIKEHPGFYAPMPSSCSAVCSRYSGHKGPCIKLTWALRQNSLVGPYTTAYTVHTSFELVEETLDHQILKFGGFTSFSDYSIPDNQAYQITWTTNVIV